MLEELEHAKARGAKIYAEVAGYGATSDGHDMVAPSGEGAVRCMRMALKNVKPPVDYINPHATSTPIGDLKEMEAIREVFGDATPPIAATKSMTGHSLGAAGAQEAIYSLLMMSNGFICESANIVNLDPAFADMPIVRERRDGVTLGLRAVELVRLRRHQCVGRVQAAGRVSLNNLFRPPGGHAAGGQQTTDGVSHAGADAGKTRADHGGRQRPFDRLGHRPHAWRRMAPRWRFTYQGEALGSRVRPLADSVGSELVLPCDVDNIASVDAVFATIKAEMGRARFPRARHRVLRQERAQGPLCRHHAREFRAHHDDLLLLVHRIWPSAPPP